jgi:hypothetical protein
LMLDRGSPVLALVISPDHYGYLCHPFRVKTRLVAVFPRVRSTEPWAAMFNHFVVNKTGGPWANNAIHSALLFVFDPVRQAKLGCSRKLKGAYPEIARSSSSRLSGRRSNPSVEASKGEDMSRKY